MNQRVTRRARAATAAAVIFLAVGGPWCRPAAAFVEVKVTVAKTYADAAAVVVGRVDAAPDANKVRVTVTETLAGTPIGDGFLVVAGSPELRALFAEGRTVVAMPNRLDKRIVILHAGDVWLTAAPLDSGKGYRVVARADTLAHTYPGGTDALADMYRLVKAGREVDLSKRADPRVLGGGVRDLGMLPAAAAGPTVPAGPAVLAWRVAGGPTLTLAVATEAGVKVFAHDGKAFAPSGAAPPAGFSTARGGGSGGSGWAAVDAAAVAAGGRELARVVGDFDETPGRPAAIVVRERGVFREPVAGPAIGASGGGGAVAGGPATGPAGAAVAVAVADFRRLTGDSLATYALGFDKGVSAVAATAIDVDGDGRQDVVILTESSGVVLANRGHGAFFVVPNLPKAMAGEGTPLPFKVGPGLRLAAVDRDGDRRQDLIAVGPDGHVWVVGNPAPPKE